MNKKIIISIIMFTTIFAIIGINYQAPSMACMVKSVEVAYVKN